LALAALAEPADARARCESGRFVLGTPEIVLGGSPVVALVIADRTVTIEGICGAARARLWRTPNNTQLRARWRGCPGIEGGIRLKAAIGLDCAVMGGVLRARRAGVASAFKAEVR
jgi:hypothetical protein